MMQMRTTRNVGVTDLIFHARTLSSQKCGSSLNAKFAQYMKYISLIVPHEIHTRVARVRNNDILQSLVIKV